MEATKHQKLIEMMEAFIAGRSRSREFVSQIEGEFAASPLDEDERFSELQLALAMFGAGDREADEKMLADECKYALKRLRECSLDSMSDHLSSYERRVNAFMREAAEDFRFSAETLEEQRQALARYLRRGAMEDHTTTELKEFLAVSNPSVLSMAGYSPGAAQRVVEMVDDITQDEIDLAL